MSIESICAGCGQKLAVSDENAGRRARCPTCGQIYTVPQPHVSPMQGAAPRVDPSLAETTHGTGSSVSVSAEPSAQVAPEEFWMKTGDGTEYGPVDRANLNRWFQEGRVGPGYQIRSGAEGLWQAAEIFRPESPAAANPYSDQSRMSGAGRATATSPTVGNYQKQDPSGLVLTMGILAWVCFLVCAPIGWVPGLVAWIAGKSALRDIQAGVADPTNLSLVQVGYYLGIAQVVLTLLFLIGGFALFGVALVLDA